MRLGHGGGAGCVVEFGILGISGIPKLRPCWFDVQRHLRELMLERLKLSDRLAELFAVLGIFDTHVSAFLCATQRIGCDQDKRCIEQLRRHRIARCEQFVDLCPVKSHFRNRTASVGRADRFNGNPVSSLDQRNSPIARTCEKEMSRIGASNIGAVAERQCCNASAFNQCIQMRFGNIIGGARYRCNRKHLTDQWSDRRRLACHFANQCSVQQPHTAVGRQYTSQAQSHECIPAWLIKIGFTVGKFVQMIHRPMIGQCPPDGVLNGNLLLGKMESHLPPSAITSRGNPSPRSPMMLR